MLWQIVNRKLVGLRLSPRVTYSLLTGEVTRLSILSFMWSPHLSCNRDQIKMRDYLDRRGTPPKRVTSPAWGPPPTCEQALREVISGTQYG